MTDKICNISIVNESTGKIIPIEEIEGSVTAGELLDAYAKKINLPAGTRGVFVRKLTHKQLLASQSLSSAGIEDGETLIADFERTAGRYQ